jgi:hypothetical protein
VGPIKSIEDFHSFRIFLFYLLDFNRYFKLFINQITLLPAKKVDISKTYIIFLYRKTEFDCNYIIKFLKEEEIKIGAEHKYMLMIKKLKLFFQKYSM